MSLEWMDGFDFYTGGHAGNAPFNQRYDDVTSGASSSFSVTTGRFGGRAMRGQGSGGTCRINARLAARTTFTVAFAYRNSNILINNSRIFGFLTGTSFQLTLKSNSDGSYYFSLADTNVPITGGLTVAGLLILATWTHLEMEVVIHDTLGEVRFWVDGVLRLNLAGLDTRGQAGSATANGVQFLGNAGGDQDLDDFHLYTTALEHKGDCRIETLVPTADTADKDWARSAGADNFAMVDESQPDADVTYLHSATPGDLDKYDLGNLSSAPSTVVAVQTTMYARKDDAVLREVRTLIDSGGSVANHTTRAMTATYAPYRDFNVTDPQGGGAWTGARVDALKAGIEVVT